jgi:hypothetical protein
MKAAKTNYTLKQITEYATFNALVNTASYHAAGRFPVVAFTLKEDAYSRLYVGDARHVYGAVINGLHPVMTNCFQYDKSVQLAKPEWMDRTVTTGQVHGLVRQGRLPEYKSIRLV